MKSAKAIRNSFIILVIFALGFVGCGSEEKEEPIPSKSLIAFSSYRDHDINTNYGAEIYVMNPDGTNIDRLTYHKGDDLFPAWSPDGKKIAFVTFSVDIPAEIWIINTDGTNLTRITTNNFFDSNPSWSSDGRKIAFSSDRTDPAGIYIMNVDGSNPVHITDDGWTPSRSPDGKMIVFGSGRDKVSDLYLMETNGKIIRRFEHPGPDRSPAWSPDGKKSPLNHPKPLIAKKFS